MQTNVKEAWTKQDIIAWLEELISRELQLSVSKIRDVKRFDALGVDSLLATYICAELTNRLGRDIDIDTVYGLGDVYTVAEKMGAPRPTGSARASSAFPGRR